MVKTKTSTKKKARTERDRAIGKIERAILDRADDLEDGGALTLMFRERPREFDALYDRAKRDRISKDRCFHLAVRHAQAVAQQDARAIATELIDDPVMDSEGAELDCADFIIQCLGDD